MVPRQAWAERKHNPKLHPHKGRIPIPSYCLKVRIFFDPPWPMLSLQHFWVVFHPLNDNVESRYLGDHESRVLEKLVTFRGLWNDPVQAHYTSLRSS